LQIIPLGRRAVRRSPRKPENHRCVRPGQEADGPKLSALMTHDLRDNSRDGPKLISAERSRTNGPRADGDPHYKVNRLQVIPEHLTPRQASFADPPGDAASVALPHRVKDGFAVSVKAAFIKI